MSSITLLVVVLAIAAVLLMLSSSRSSAARAQREQWINADEMLTRAESKFLVGEFAEAEYLFQSAFLKAEKVDTLLASEALYGIARVRMRHSRFAEAVPILEQALALKSSWPVAKPNFEQLLARELERARAEASSASR
ncbi:MAG TPA: tetratricopeptide repeat protein [Candidatus Obscuribacterales bacterium]